MANVPGAAQNANGGNGNQCPAGCCDGTELLCVSIPCPVQIVLLGTLNLELELPCLKLSSQSPITGGQAGQLLEVLRALLGTLGGSLPTGG